MRYGIISDIHGNLEAFEAVLEECRNQGVRQYFCIGDIVGYGANPAECIALNRKIKAITVAGNHDWAVCGKMKTDQFNDVAQEAVDWTQQQLSTEDLKYLNDLPLEWVNDDFQMVHGSLNHPEEFNYIMDTRDTNDTFYMMKKNLCFVGHTHKPQIYAKTGDYIALSDAQNIVTDKASTYVVNVGSVGQPRDGNRDACYAIFDPDLNEININRANYDIRKAQDKILNAGLPAVLAKRLSIGQ